METSQAIGGKSDLENQSTKSWSRMLALVNLQCFLHSWIWSEKWVEVDCLIKLRSLVPISYQMGSWKCVKNAIARELKWLN